MQHTTRSSIPTFTPSRLRRSVAAGLISMGLLSVATAAQAIEVYKTDTDRVEFSGRLAAFAVIQDGEHDDIYNGGSRVRLIYEHEFQQGWNSIAYAEWGFDPWFKDGTDAHYKRSLYAGASNDRYGSFTVGKQYGPWYDMVAGNTDWFWINGGEASGSFNGRSGDGGLHGTGRPDNSIYWKKDIGEFTVGLLYQLSHDGKHSNDEYSLVDGTIVTDTDYTGYERDYSYETALNWNPTDDLTIGGVFHHTELTDYDNSGSAENGDIDAWLVGGHWSPGNWYLAMVAGEYRNHISGSVLDSSEDFVDKARGAEVVVNYKFKDVIIGDDSVELYGGLNHLEDTSSEARYAYQVLGTAWRGKGFTLASEYRFDNSRQSDGSEYSSNHDQLMFLARYDF